MTTIRLFLPAALSLAAFALSTATARAADPPAWKWAPGDTARYQLTQTMAMSMDAGAAGQIETSRTETKLLALSVDSIDESAARLRQAT
ncbi:MAG: hypothetical protein AAF743_14350, partial [Planctomycetota bacterium]